MIGQLDSLLAQLDALCVRALEQLDAVTTLQELSEWYRRYLGRKSGELILLRSVAVGPERAARVKYGIGDMRLFSGNDLRFLQQF